MKSVRGNRNEEVGIINNHHAYCIIILAHEALLFDLLFEIPDFDALVIGS